MRNPFVSGRPHLPDGVVLHDRGARLVLEATADLAGLAGGSFSRSDVHVSFGLDPTTDQGLELAGWSFTQFALPVRARVGRRRFDFNPSPTLHAPAAVVPLLARRRDGSVVLAAPLDSWHEQVITVIQDDDGPVELRWGWHGDLDRVPAGFRTTLGLYTGAGPAEVLARWAAEVGPIDRPDGNPVVTHLSYWTDNGAAYWYRREPDRDLATSVVDTVAALRESGVPVGPVELDSWFYPHETPRPITAVGYPEDVPPTGMLTWTARPDALPDGIGGLSERLGFPPLVLHARHLSTASPYLDDGEWWVDLVAQPVDPGFFRRWFDDAASWGAVCIEQDWMLLIWFGVRQLREEPGRAQAWLAALDRAATETGVGVLLCMATPADLLAAAGLPGVVAVRTSDDYRYAEDAAFLWHWYLTVNALIGPLGLPAFKDCFLSGPPGSDPIDGDSHREVEALLSAFSAGPAGIGDRLGRTDPDLVHRLCRPDGVLVGPDRPLALADPSFFRPWDADGALCWATTHSGRWRYVVALHTAATDRPITDRFDLDGRWLVYDWRAGAARPAERIEVTLDHRDWALFVCCPIEDGPAGPHALVGDPARLVTMGRQRVRWDGPECGPPEVHRAPAEGPVELRWWSVADGLSDRPA